MNDNQSSKSKPVGALPTVGNLDPVGLLEQGMSEDTIVGVAAGRLFQPPRPEELMEMLPQFDDIAFIGAGGMGAVYKARQKGLDRVVALKILPREIGSDPAFSELFAREAKALAQLNHPNIVTLYDYGCVNGLYYMVMEYVDGVNLAQLIARGRISPREALAIVPQICDALQYAHDKGVVHRDIKPENILLDREGRVKVADFGLAKLLFCTGEIDGGDGRRHEGGTMLLKDGKVMGTPAYMSPEQCSRPGDVDNRADIYSLGVVLYQMLTGRLPDHPITPPSQHVSIDVKLDEIVLKALEECPAERYRHVSEMKTALATPQQVGEPGGKRPGGRLSFLPGLMGLVAVIVIAMVILGYGIYAWHGNREKTDGGIHQVDGERSSLVSILDSIPPDLAEEALRYEVCSVISEALPDGIGIENMDFLKVEPDAEGEVKDCEWVVTFFITRHGDDFKFKIARAKTDEGAERYLLNSRYPYPFAQREGKIIFIVDGLYARDLRPVVRELAAQFGFPPR